jgi:hypothetical protein
MYSLVCDIVALIKYMFVQLVCMYCIIVWHELIMSLFILK